MSASISILGNTGGNVQLRYSEQGTPVASFSIASNSFRKTQGERVPVTEWYNVTAFGKLAETLAEHVTKGTQLLVLGKVSFKPWLTNNGEPRAGAEVILQSFEFAGGNRNGNAVTDVESADAPPPTNGSVPVVQAASGSEPFNGQF